MYGFFTVNPFVFVVFKNSILNLHDSNSEMFVSFTHPCDHSYTHYAGCFPAQVTLWERYVCASDHLCAPKYYWRSNEWHVFCKRLLLANGAVDIMFHVTVLTKKNKVWPAPDLGQAKLGH